jgi:hypothetical protein
MQRVFISLLCFLFLISGPISVWADCFRHAHETVGEGHHHGGAFGSIQATHAEPDHSAPWFHCPQTRFDLQSLVSLSAKSDPKLRDHEYNLAPHSDLSREQGFLNAQNRFISSSAGRFPRYPFLVGLSPHLLLSVFRI